MEREPNQTETALAFRRGLITNLLNPKAAVFYVAVLPEFIQVDGGPVVLQTLLWLRVNPYIAQLAAGCAFIGVGIVLNYAYVFRRRKK